MLVVSWIQVIEYIAEANEKNFNKLKEELGKLKPHEGKINSKQLWKLKKSLCPTTKDAPCAMNDKSGNLITSEKTLQKRALEVYYERLEGNTIKSNLKNYEDFLWANLFYFSVRPII